MKKITMYNTMMVALLITLVTAPNLHAQPQALTGDQAEKIGKVMFESSDDDLNNTYQWAKKQALAYAFEDDPVGLWYEAALPGREAFCMRDVAHQSLGAHVLGLDPHTKNMMYKFAENISESKDWCSYWEINRYGNPAPVDYYSDAAFWYNLPANFDIMDAIYRMYLWTGDRTYINDPAFLNFYKRTVYDYVRRWDLGLDRVMTRERIMNQPGGVAENNRFQIARGIPSYNESDDSFIVGLDQLVAQYAGYKAYANIQALRGNETEAADFMEKAGELKEFINTRWWNEEKQLYYTHLDTAHQLYGEGDRDILYYDVTANPDQIKAVLDHTTQNLRGASMNSVEGLSHVSEVLYRYERPQPAYDLLLDLTGSDRREYPEVSYSMMGAITKGLMGIELEVISPLESIEWARYVDRFITTIPRLTGETDWAEIRNVSIRANEIAVRHEGTETTIFTNQQGPSLKWKAYFPGSYETIAVNGQSREATQEEAFPGGPQVSWVEVIVGAGESFTVEAE